MQNTQTLQTQIEALKEIITVLEDSQPDQVTRLWRAKVYEELLKNKQQKFSLNLEVKGFREEEGRFRVKEQEMRSALDYARSQISTMNTEKARMYKEMQLKVKSSAQGVTSTLLPAMQCNLNCQLETMTRVLALLETYHHKLASSLSRLKTVKRLLNLEKDNEKAKFSEMALEFSGLETENERLNQELLGLYEERDEFQSNETIFVKEVESLKQSLDNALCNFNEENQQKAQSFNEIIEKLTRENEEKQSLIQTLQCKVQELTTSICILNNEKTDIYTQFDFSQTEIAELTQELARQQAENSDTHSHSRTLISELRLEITRLDAQLTDSEGKHSETSHSFTNLESSYQQELEALELENQLNKKKFEAQVRELKRDRDILFEHLRKLEKSGPKDSAEPQTPATKKTAVLRTTTP